MVFGNIKCGVVVCVDLILFFVIYKFLIWEYFGFCIIEDNGKKIFVFSDIMCKYCFVGVFYNLGNMFNMIIYMKMYYLCIDLFVCKKNILYL